MTPNDTEQSFSLNNSSSRAWLSFIVVLLIFTMIHCAFEKTTVHFSFLRVRCICEHRSGGSWRCGTKDAAILSVWWHGEHGFTHGVYWTTYVFSDYLLSCRIISYRPTIYKQKQEETRKRTGWPTRLRWNELGLWRLRVSGLRGVTTATSKWYREMQWPRGTHRRNLSTTCFHSRFTSPDDHNATVTVSGG